jgi:hypothetical protein
MSFAPMSVAAISVNVIRCLAATIPGVLPDQGIQAQGLDIVLQSSGAGGRKWANSA